jgi:hypothetical protein
MNNLHNRLTQEKGTAPTTATQYLQTLFSLNDKKPFRNLAFLRDTERISTALQDKAISTQKTIVSVLLSVLDFYKKTASYKKTYQFYDALLTDKKDALAETQDGTKTSKQEKNWEDWETVLEKKTQLRTAVQSFSNEKKLTAAQYETLLSYVVLSLYTDIPPRRNQDFMDMYVVKEEPADDTKNYYVLGNQTFVFNKYKTKKTYGKQVIPVPNTPEAPLADTLALYLKYHAGAPARITKKTEFPLLVKQDGTPMNPVNGLTRLLNHIFGKKVGSSMLRHSYLTMKYGDMKEGLEADTEQMAHSPAMALGTYVVA